MVSFAPAPTGVTAHLEEREAQLLRELVKEMRMLLEADIPKEDAVVSRLFPEAYEDDADEKAYEELLGDQLRTAKLEALRMVDESLGEGPLDTVLSEDQATAMLTLLTDLRLAIGTRLEVTEDTMAREFEEDDPDAAALSVLHWLGWVQESLLAAMNP